jgi:hypothetical protein
MGGTAGGAAKQFLYEPGIHVSFLGRKLLLGAIFAPLCPQVLLGREDFFRYFKAIRFEQAKQKMHLDGVTDWDKVTKEVQTALRGLSLGVREQVAREGKKVPAVATP